MSRIPPQVPTRMNQFARVLVIAAGSGLALMCAPETRAGVAGIEGPWSTLATGGVPNSVDDYVPLIVSSIDGEVPTQKHFNVTPGKKQILLDTALTKSASRAPTHKRLELTMEPCMRYYVAGKKPSPLSLRWEPIIFRKEAIGECAAEFNVKVSESNSVQPMEKTDAAAHPKP